MIRFKISHLDRYLYQKTDKNSTGARSDCINPVRSFPMGIYVGVTSNLIKRVWEHKNKVVEGFTKKYGCARLVYYEQHADMLEPRKSSSIDYEPLLH